MKRFKGVKFDFGQFWKACYTLTVRLSTLSTVKIMKGTVAYTARAKKIGEKNQFACVTAA